MTCTNRRRLYQLITNPNDTKVERFVEAGLGRANLFGRIRAIALHAPRSEASGERPVSRVHGAALPRSAAPCFPELAVATAHAHHATGLRSRSIGLGRHPIAHGRGRAPAAARLNPSRFVLLCLHEARGTAPMHLAS